KDASCSQIFCAFKRRCARSPRESGGLHAPFVRIRRTSAIARRPRALRPVARALRSSNRPRRRRFQRAREASPCSCGRFHAQHRQSPANAKFFLPLELQLNQACSACVGLTSPSPASLERSCNFLPPSRIRPPVTPLLTS